MGWYLLPDTCIMCCQSDCESSSRATTGQEEGRKEGRIGMMYQGQKNCKKDKDKITYCNLRTLSTIFTYEPPQLSIKQILSR